MSQDQVQSLLEKAGDLYNQGQYDKAIETWNEVLRADPVNQKANEGIRMASLLKTHDVEREAAAEQSSNAEDFRDRIEAIMLRVRDLVAAGNYEDAVDGCTLLQDLAAGDPDVERLCEEVRKAFPGEPAPMPPPVRSEGTHVATAGGDVESLLLAARRALERGDEEEASRAASAALAQDPGCMEAIAILSMTGGGPAATLRPGPANESGSRHMDGAAARDLQGAIAVDDLIDTSNEPVGFPEIDPDTSPAIKELIEEGQRAFDAGRMQDAIGVWSRIFALDEDNQLAGDLIDRARRSIESSEEHVDRLFQQAVDAREAGRLDEALELFRKVRALSPMHAELAAAIEEVDAKLAGEAVSIGLDSQAVGEADEERAGAFAGDADPEEEVEEGAWGEGNKSAEGAVPHAVERPRADASRQTPAFAAAKESFDKPAASFANTRLRVLLGGVGAAIVLGAAFWAWTSFGTDAGISDAAATTPQQEAPRPPKGKGAPAQQEPAPAPQEEPEPLALDQAKDKARQHANAGWEHYQKGNWAEAVKELREARRIDPLFSMQDTLDSALQNLEAQAEFETEMDAATKYFGEGDYASSLHKLYRLQQKYPRRAPFDSIISAAWFNWGALLMDAGAIDEALEKFNEALEINPRDADAKRAREVAMRYQERPRDPAFDTFVKTLVPRRMGNQ